MLKSRFSPRNFSRAWVRRGGSALPTFRAAVSIRNAATRASHSGTDRRGRSMPRPSQMASMKLRLDLRLRVAVDVPPRQRLRLVGAVVVPRRVDAEAGEVDEAPQRPALARLEEVAQAADVDGAVLLDRPPVADLCRGVEDDLGA